MRSHREMRLNIGLWDISHISSVYFDKSEINATQPGCWEHSMNTDTNCIDNTYTKIYTENIEGENSVGESISR